MKYLFLVLLFCCTTGLFAQPKAKLITECTVEFSVNVDSTKAPSGLQQTSVVLYIKNNLSRLDFINTRFTQKKFFDSKRNAAVILQELGGTKVMRSIDSSRWVELNRKFEGARIAYSNDAKTILGYECKKAVITLRDSAAYTIYYATAIIPSNRSYEYQFRDIPGFVLEYETVAEGSSNKVLYTANKINLSPVPSSKFEIPKAGYRVL
jgi:GLPGLI family protein